MADASARRTYDLTDPHERSLLYEFVLLGAGRPQDLSDWLDGEELVRLWHVSAELVGLPA